MASGTINKTVNESGTGYCKMPDGTLFCYGTTYCNVGTTTINFSPSFTAEPSVCFSQVTASPTMYIYTVEVTTDHVAFVNTSTAGVYLKWQAIGRWI